MVKLNTLFYTLACTALLGAWPMSNVYAAMGTARDQTRDSVVHRRPYPAGFHFPCCRMTLR